MLGVEAWTTIRYLQAQGVGIRAICRQLGVSRTAVRRALRSDGSPHYQRSARPNPQLVPYEARIHAWYFGQHLIGSRILRELRKIGYTGGPTAVYAYLRELRGAIRQGDGPLRDPARSAGSVRLVAVHAGSGRRAHQGDRLWHDPGLQPTQALHGQPG